MCRSRVEQARSFLVQAIAEIALPETKLELAQRFQDFCEATDEMISAHSDDVFRRARAKRDSEP